MKLFILFLVIFSSAAFAQLFNAGPNSIILNAAKDTSVTADEMVIEITVNKTDTSISKVNEITHNKLVDVIKVLENYGYKKDDIYLISSNLRNQYPRPNEYFSIQTYKIILTKFELYDQLKEDLVRAGATGVSISTLWVKDYEKIRKNLYDEAIKDAEEKAKYLSSKIGAKLVKVENIQDNSREESINSNVSFMNNSFGIGINAVTISTQSLKVAPTITNGKINISVALRITFGYSY